MSITIDKSIDIEDEVRTALKTYQTAYCRPLPASLSVPSIEIRKVGGGDAQTIDTATVMLYSRGNTPYEADDYLREAIGILKAVCKAQTTELRHIEVNSSGGWGTDPVRPDLALCTATLIVVAHQTTTEVSEL